MIPPGRYEVRSTGHGYGVWDRGLCGWVEPELGEAASLSELDAEMLLHDLEELP